MCDRADEKTRAWLLLQRFSMNSGQREQRLAKTFRTKGEPDNDNGLCVVTDTHAGTRLDPRYVVDDITAPRRQDAQIEIRFIIEGGERILYTGINTAGRDYTVMAENGRARADCQQPHRRSRQERSQHQDLDSIADACRPV